MLRVHPQAYAYDFPRRENKHIPQTQVSLIQILLSSLSLSAKILAMKKITNYLKEVKTELEKVTWPKREETVRLTATVILFSALIAAYVGLLDFLFTNLLTKIFQG